MRKLFVLLLIQAWACSIAFGQTLDGHPDWIMRGNVYEVNIRQYSKDGTFKAFGKNIDRLKDMGVQTLWLMPINPISKANRRGKAGYYYAVANYTAVNPEFGTLKDFKKLVADAHKAGMKVIIDWAANHTGADHVWLKKHPDFYAKDKTGKPAVPFDLIDCRQLNYANVAMQDSMINAMRYWINTTGIDGFRCNLAWNIPADFWKKCISNLRRGRNLLFIADGDKNYLPSSGFDAISSPEMLRMMTAVAKGTRPANNLDNIKAKYDKQYPKNTLELYFTSNHDENSLNKADFGTFPGDAHAPFAVFTQTMPHSVPLIYTGQEEPIDRALKYFDKDPIKIRKRNREKFYTTLLTLRKQNQALSSDASFRKVNVGDAKAVYAYVREKGNSKILVILNLSAHDQMITIEDETLLGKATNVFRKAEEPVTNKPWKLNAWGYYVYNYDSQ